MKLAVLLQCHKNPHQINVLLEAMKHPDITFFVHIDKKSNIGSKLFERKDVVLLPESKRIDVQWAKISQVDATINLLDFAQKSGKYDYYWLCSGQDFPIQSSNRIIRYLVDNAGCDFIELFPSMNNGLYHGCNYDKRNELFFPDWILGNGSIRRILKRLYVEITGGYNHTFSWAKRNPVDNMKFYFGSCWMCLSKRTTDWILEYIRVHPEYYNFFSHSNCPDESFFQTLVMNSPFAKARRDYLHYVEWIEGKSNPKVLTCEDLPKLLESGKLMARKFDEDTDDEVINKLLKIIEMEEAK